MSKSASDARPTPIVNREYRLDDRYTLQSGRVYLSGSQALVRLPMLQRQRDLVAGLNTAGFVSGYTGSPLGGYDLALKQAAGHLAEHHVHFQPGVNEELAATAVSGSQQTGLVAGPKYDGVFAIWYGKGPGVDRAGDALKHGSYAGASTHGGVLVLAGDDHGAKSSTTAHQSDQAFIHFGMPYLNPSNVQDYLDFGLYGFELSRYSGCWVGMKCVTDTVESSATVTVDPLRIQVRVPTNFTVPAEGLNIRWGVLPQHQELRQYQQRIPAAQAFVRANVLDRVIRDAPVRRIGIVTTGKAYLDVMQALDELGLDEAACRGAGVSVYKVAMPWPLEPVNAVAFAEGQAELLIVEEKRGVIEEQFARLLYHAASKPRLVGKRDEEGRPAVSAEGELNSTDVALIIGRRLVVLWPDEALARRLAQLEHSLAGDSVPAASLRRLPAFCAGCPHNTSTRVPEGSVALGGIGCHGMALFLPERRTLTMAQMGGEGAPWIGIAPFSNTSHIFQNLGDGTYFHSGLMAIRAAVAAGVNITYKILVNDAVAMTGGQEIAGQVRVDELTRQLHAEGVRRIAVVTTDLEQYSGAVDFAPGVTRHHRDKLDEVQRDLREWPGVSALVYDQTCATELRRRRKRGTATEPDQRTFINQAVCEGCGDCSVQSNCIAIEPVETEFGRKRQINQSACNKDFSCLKGYCPSFVTVRGGKPRARGNREQAYTGFDHAANHSQLPAPATADCSAPYNILVTGIGGSGVVTMGALLGVAAHLEGKACSVLDVAGLAQRNGPVTSHIRVAGDAGVLHATRIAAAGAELVLGSDIVVTAGPDALSRIRTHHTQLVVNDHVAPTFAFATNRDLDLSPETLIGSIAAKAGGDRVQLVAATDLAYALMGNTVAANLFLMGYALQKGLLPVGVDALERAVELNGVQVEMNRASLSWGRLAAHDPALVDRIARGNRETTAPAPKTFGELVDHRAAFLAKYQDEAYATRYRVFVERVARCEKDKTGRSGTLSVAVARYYAKLLAYKDEYEVARLYTDPAFRRRLNEEFEGDFQVEYNMAPPLLQSRDPATGRYRKRVFGPWMEHVFPILANLRFLRGTRLDVFGYGKHRRRERQLIAEYEKTIESLLVELGPGNVAVAAEIAALPETIRGYDIVKDADIEKAKVREAQLLDQFKGASMNDPAVTNRAEAS